MENINFSSADVAMRVNENGMSQYTKLYYQQLEKYQLLLCLYLGSFEVGNGETITKENGCFTWQVNMKNCLVVY